MLEIKDLIRRLNKELKAVYDDIANKEEELRDLRDEADRLEDRLEKLNEEERLWKTEPDDLLRCLCGERVLLEKTAPKSAAYLEGLVFTVPSPKPHRSHGGSLVTTESCPGCGMDPGQLVEELNVINTKAPAPHGVARGSELQPELFSIGPSLAGDGA